jgi:hypothetical protein
MKTDIKGITKSELVWFGNITLDARIKAEGSRKIRKMNFLFFVDNSLLAGNQ